MNNQKNEKMKIKLNQVEQDDTAKINEPKRRSGHRVMGNKKLDGETSIEHGLY